MIKFDHGQSVRFSAFDQFFQTEYERPSSVLEIFYSKELAFNQAPN